MIPQFNAIILDVVLVLLLIIVALFGALKGIKHVTINFLLLLGSIAISFTSFTGFLKGSIIDILAPYVKLGAGVGENVKLAVYLSYTFFASLILCLLVYLIFRLIKYLIVSLLKRRDINNNKLPPCTSVASRVGGGIVNFLLGGVLLIVGLSILNTPIIGLDKTTKNSYITKHVENLDDLIIDKVAEGKMIEEKAMIMLLTGDLFAKIDDDGAKALKGLYKVSQNQKFSPNDLNNIQENLDLMYDVLVLVDLYALDENGAEVDGFENAVALIRDMMNKAVNQMNSLNTNQEPMDANKTLAISNLLKRLGLKESAIIFENTFVIR